MDSIPSNNNKIHPLETQDLSSGKRREIDELLKVIVRRFIKGYSTGVCVHAAYALITSTLKRSLKDGLYKAWESVFSKSTFQTSMFMGLFPSLYRAALHYVKKTRQTEDSWNYLVSGAIAGLSILSLDKSKRHTLTFFSLSRAIGAVVTSLVARGDLPYIPHTNIAVFSVFTGLILYAVVLHPDYLSSPGYYRSILKWTQNYTDELAKKLFRDPSPRFVKCHEVLHKGSCLKYNLLSFKDCYPMAAKIYFPIHALPILFYKRKALVTNPSSVIKSFLINMASSTSFLVVMVVVAKTSLCALRNANPKPPPVSGVVPLVSGSLGAFCGILCERKSRHKELALYTVFQALEIFYNAFKNSSRVSKNKVGVPQGFTMMFCLATMVIMHAYEAQPDYINSTMKAVLKFFVGERDIDSKKVGYYEKTTKEQH